MTLAGLTPEEREDLRRKYRDRAIARAEQQGVTLRCRRHLDDLEHPDHLLCRGEGPGGAGCLCRCHDKQAAAVNEEQQTGGEPDGR